MIYQNILILFKKDVKILVTDTDYRGGYVFVKKGGMWKIISATSFQFYYKPEFL